MRASSAVVFASASSRFSSSSNRIYSAIVSFSDLSRSNYALNSYTSLSYFFAGFF
jgi:hypothetical protein